MQTIFHTQLDEEAQEKRNFLRFGKRVHEEMGPYAMTQLKPDNNNIQGLHRRDYREFVRFGKRSDAVDKKHDDFLRFGRQQLNGLKKFLLYQQSKNFKPVLQDKKSNDFLRFG